MTENPYRRLAGEMALQAVLIRRVQSHLTESHAAGWEDAAMRYLAMAQALDAGLPIPFSPTPLAIKAAADAVLTQDAQPTLDEAEGIGRRE